MSDKTPREPKPRQTKRYLMEIRGVLHVDAPNGDAAREAVQAWIDATVKAAEAAQDTPPAEGKPTVRIGWLRPFPED